MLSDTRWGVGVVVPDGRTATACSVACAVRRRACVLLAALAVLAAAGANAACPLNAPHFRVGADTTYCSHHDIQSAINAAGACPAIIEITREHLYTGGYCDPNQPSGCHLTIAGQSITLQGRADGETCYALTQCIPGPSCPAPSATTPLVTLDGGNNGRVLTVTGASNVNVRNLTITHGDAGNGGSGGGINFDGSGNLNITRSTLATNHAGYGGGINARGTGTLRVRLQDDTLLQNNTAESSGAGVRVEGTTRLYATSDHVLVSQNHALTGYGGGIEILGPARADLGSAGFNGAGVVSNNDGVYGAGIAVVDNGNGEAVLRTFADAASRPTVISNNGGALQGGGIFLAGDADACLYASRIAANIAEEGAAIFQTCERPGAEGCGDSVIAGTFLNGGAPEERIGVECGPEPVANLGGTTNCLPGDAQCSAIVGNLTRHPDSTPSAGATIRSVAAEFAGTRFRMRENIAGDGFNLINMSVALDRCLIADNGFSGNLLYGEITMARIHGCTIAGNSIGAGFVVNLPSYSSVDFAYDIFAQPGKYTVYWGDFGGAFDVSYVLSNSIDGLPQNNPSILQGTPVFVDAANGDYHLAPIVQTALDFGGPNTTPDLDGNYAVDLPQVTNRFGTLDLGAYERQNFFYCGTSDSIFCHSFDS